MNHISTLILASLFISMGAQAQVGVETYNCYGAKQCLTASCTTQSLRDAKEFKGVLTLVDKQYLSIDKSPMGENKILAFQKLQAGGDTYVIGQPGCEQMMMTVWRQGPGAIKFVDWKDGQHIAISVDQFNIDDPFFEYPMICERIN